MNQRRLSLPTLSILTTFALLLQVAVQAAPPVGSKDTVATPAAPTAPGEPPVISQRVVTPEGRPAEKLYSFKFEGSGLDIVMQAYCQWTGQIYLKNDAINASISVKANDLTKQECIQVVDAILGMNGITLVPMGEKFIKVIQTTTPDLVGQGLTVSMDPEKEYGNTDKLVTQIIQLQNVGIPDVQAAVQHLMHSYGKIMALERSNSLMITDTAANIVRIRELLEFIDQASAGIEPKIYKIEYADAVEITSKLSEIIALAQEDQKATTGTASIRRTPAGVVRARTIAQPAQPAAPTQATFSKTESSGDLIIHGKVKVVADERTNIIIIFSQEDNFKFFDTIIKVLDVEVDPAITFEVVNLEYADASDLAGTLNELVGAATGARGSSSGTSRSSSSRTSSSRTSGIQRANSGSTSSRSTSRVTPNASPASVENLSRLSEETRILADERSNSVLLMGEKSDIAALKNVIASLDIMLEQVIIEAAIFEIGLTDTLTHGISWLYKNADQSKIGSWDGSSLVTNTLSSLVGGAMNYYQTIPGLDSEVLINLAKTDGDARVISTPVIMTTDNTEASLSIGEQRPVVTSTSSFSNSSGTQSSNYEYKDIGIQLTITPRINPERMVVMELTQKADQIGEFVEIDNNQVPTILNREFEASIAVPDGETVVLGGLVTTDYKDTVNKIPILGDIPLIGRYLFSSVQKVDIQRELIVLMTPYVVINHKEMQQQTDRLYKGADFKKEDWGDNNWSGSRLREIPDPDDIEDELTDYHEVEPEAVQDNTPSPEPDSTEQLTAEEAAEMQQLLNTLGQ